MHTRKLGATVLGIGIDTGGTYTDAVVVDRFDNRVLAEAKALTTKDDLSIGIGNALDALPDKLRAQARSVSLSTTLATNACVEGKGGRAKLVIVGASPKALRSLHVDQTYGIPLSDVLAVDIHVDPKGKSIELPDWQTLCSDHADFFDDADSFGIAGVHALKNGGVMEKDGAAFLEQRFGKLVVKAIDVASEVNVYERGATALLNARLVPVIQEFLDAIRQAMAARGLGDVPVSIVRSDGTLMSEELARTRPVETILSGPAASVRGAQVLAPADEAVVVDIGGTTSDMALFHQGKPVRCEHIRIGGWETQVGGIAIDTIGLGGDSAARYSKIGTLELSHERVLPFCIAATRWPRVVDELEVYLRSASPNHLARYEFFSIARPPINPQRYSPAERELLDLLEDGPVCLNDTRLNRTFVNSRRLEAEGVVLRCGMTPTDAMHLLGLLNTFDVRASELGARCLLKSYQGAHAAREEKSAVELATEICNLASKRLYEQAGRVLLADGYLKDTPQRLDGQMQAVFERNWERRMRPGTPRSIGQSQREASSSRDQHEATSDQGCSIGHGHGENPNSNPPHPRNSAFSLLPHTDAVLVGIGAPTHVFLPDAAHALGAQFCVPEHAGVANAVGAICAPVAVEIRVHVRPERGTYGTVEGYHVFAAGESTFVPSPTIDDVDGSGERQAKELAIETARRLAREEAHRRGTEDSPECTVTEDETRFTGAADGRTITYEWIYTASIEA